MAGVFSEEDGEALPCRGFGLHNERFEREENTEHGSVRAEPFSGVRKCEFMSCDRSRFSMSLTVVISLSNRLTEGLRLFPTSVIKTRASRC